MGLTGARAPSEVIDFNQLGRLELDDVDFKQWSAALCVVWGGGCRRRHSAFDDKSDKHRKQQKRDLNLLVWSLAVC